MPLPLLSTQEKVHRPAREVHASKTATTRLYLSAGWTFKPQPCAARVSEAGSMNPAELP
jgi:hypothetical protein